MALLFPVAAAPYRRCLPLPGPRFGGMRWDACAGKDACPPRFAARLFYKNNFHFYTWLMKQFILCFP